MRIEVHQKSDSYSELFQREVSAVPAVGSFLYWNTDASVSGQSRYRVIEVKHIYEDREWYLSHGYVAERVCVVVEKTTDR
jgi:hypothetical protein